MDIVHRLQQSICTSTGDSTGTSIGDGTDIGVGKGIGSGMGTGTGVGEHDMDYCLIADGLVRFKDKIYVLDRSELKKMILRVFHVKPYLCHPSYYKTLTTAK